MMSKAISRRDFTRIAAVGVMGTLGTLGALSTPLLSACSSLKGSNPNGNLGTNRSEVIVAMPPSNEPAAGFNPFFNWGTGDHSHEPLIHSTLITTTPSMGFANDLATGYRVSDDSLFWTFTIRDDVSFSDGHPLTARDVAFTINGIKTSHGSTTDLNMIDQAVAKDDVTIEISLKRPWNALLYTLAVIGIIPEHAYDANYGAKPIGSGRYLLEQWDRGQQVILKANPNYYGEASKMQRVVVVFTGEDSALAAVRAGQVDIAATSAVFSGQRIEGYELVAIKSVDSRGISLPSLSRKDLAMYDLEYPPGNDPVSGPVTSDIAIRRALNYAIDRDLMVRNVLNGHGTAAFSVADGMPWASLDMRLTSSVETAKTMLSNGGWLPGADGILQKSGMKATVSLLYPAGDSLRQSLAHEFSNQARQIGIDVQIEGLSWDSIYHRQYFDLVLWGWGSNSPTELYNLYHSNGTCNFPQYKSAVIDGYLEAALATPAIEESFSLWQKAQWDGTQGVAPQGAASWVWLVNVDHLYFKREGLNLAQQKLHPHGHGWSLLNNVDRWTWK